MISSLSGVLSVRNATLEGDLGAKPDRLEDPVGGEERDPLRHRRRAVRRQAHTAHASGSSASGNAQG